MDLFKDLAQVVSFCIMAISAVVTVFLFFRSKNKDREKETFDYIDDKFLDYLGICMDKPYLDIFDVPDEIKIELNDEQKKEEKIAFAYLISIFERVYIFYHENGRAHDSDQFINWQRTIKEYFERESFRRAWEENGYGWDAGFIIFMDRFYLNIEKKIILSEITSDKDLDQWYDEYEKCFKTDGDNDTKDDLLDLLKHRGVHGYHFYFVRKNDESQDKPIVGGLLTQKINNAVFILYIFTIKKFRKHGYANLALKELKTRFNDQVMFLAEVEHYKQHVNKPWWINNMFSEVNMAYHTPETDKKKCKETGSHCVNDLMIFSSRPVKPRKLMHALKMYFKTSFVKRNLKPAFLFKAVKENNKQIREFKKVVEVKI